jgi:ParB-like chromosome segregation protein Spo0J
MDHLERLIVCAEDDVGDLPEPVRQPSGRRKSSIRRREMLWQKSIKRRDEM